MSGCYGSVFFIAGYCWGPREFYRKHWPLKASLKCHIWCLLMQKCVQNEFFGKILPWPYFFPSWICCFHTIWSTSSLQPNKIFVWKQLSITNGSFSLSVSSINKSKGDKTKENNFLKEYKSMWWSRWKGKIKLLQKSVLGWGGPHLQVLSIANRRNVILNATL